MLVPSGVSAVTNTGPSKGLLSVFSETRRYVLNRGVIQTGIFIGRIMLVWMKESIENICICWKGISMQVGKYKMTSKTSNRCAGCGCKSYTLYCDDCAPPLVSSGCSFADEFNKQTLRSNIRVFNEYSMNSVNKDK